MSEKITAVGLDIGTMFFQSAYADKDSIVLKNTRNVFVEFPSTEDTEEILKQNKWQFVKDGNIYYVIGEDAMKIAKMFPDKVILRRPMQDGVLNKNEDKKILVVAKLIESDIGKAMDDKSVVCTCISSPSVDSSLDSDLHKAMVSGMISRLGWQIKIIEEAFAVILEERPCTVDSDGNQIPYSGLGLSFGAGRVNAVLAYRGVQVLGMSMSKSGDWIDNQVSKQTGKPISHVTNSKEKNLDLDNVDYSDDVLFALDVYYGSMIESVLKAFSNKFIESKSQFEGPLDIVVAGGTSMPKGFINKFSKIVKNIKLPFEIKEIRLAKDPRNTVVKGCLAQAIVTRNKMLK